MTVRYEMKDEAVALITLNRPQALNAFNAEMRSDLIDAVAKASADKAVRAYIITGEGRGFSAGADVTDVSGTRVVGNCLSTHFGV